MASTDEIPGLLIRFFETRAPMQVGGDSNFCQSIACVLKRCRFKVSAWEDAYEDGFGESHVLETVYSITLYVSPADFDVADEPSFDSAISRAMVRLLYDDNERFGALTVKALLEQDQEPPGLNNCYFKKQETILHDGLRFRSPAEVSIYDELKRHKVLFLPNPAAVFGNSAEVKPHEPDFLVCCEGKWGLLEINGNEYHSGIVRTTKDHERARRFQHYGVFFIQAYDAIRCVAEPDVVVLEFLRLLAKYK